MSQLSKKLRRQAAIQEEERRAIEEEMRDIQRLLDNLFRAETPVEAEWALSELVVNIEHQHSLSSAAPTVLTELITLAMNDSFPIRHRALAEITYLAYCANNDSALNKKSVEFAVRQVLVDSKPKFQHLANSNEPLIRLHATRVLAQIDSVHPCPECGQNLRTPKAQQCLHCGSDWHAES